MLSADLLRRTREAKGLSLEDLERTTRIRAFYLGRLEMGDFSALPSGLYARSYLRAYATAVGLDPESTVHLFAERLPQAQELTAVPVTSNGGTSRPGGGPAAPAPSFSSARLSTSTVEAARLAWSGPASRRATPRAAVEAGDGVTHLPVRTHARDTTRHAAIAARNRPIGRPARAVAAAIVDLVLLAIIAAGVAAATATMTGQSAWQLFPRALPALAVLLLVVAWCYFWLLGGIAGWTCGSRLLGVTFVSRRHLRDLDSSFRRAGDFVGEEWGALARLLRSASPETRAESRQDPPSSPVPARQSSSG